MLTRPTTKKLARKPAEKPAKKITGDETVLDLRGLRCPQPVLRAKKALRAVAIGGTLVLECTDPLTVIDVPAFTQQTGHTLAEQRRDGALYIFKIVKRR